MLPPLFKYRMFVLDENGIEHELPVLRVSGGDVALKKTREWCQGRGVRPLLERGVSETDRRFNWPGLKLSDLEVY